MPIKQPTDFNKASAKQTAHLSQSSSLIYLTGLSHSTPPLSFPEGSLEAEMFHFHLP